MDDTCNGCYYNRPLKTWGEMVDACWRGVDIQNEDLEEVSDGGCSGFDQAIRQLEMAI